MHSGELSQESLEELNLNRVTHNSDIGKRLVDPRSVPTERTSDHKYAYRAEGVRRKYMLQTDFLYKRVTKDKD